MTSALCSAAVAEALAPYDLAVAHFPLPPEFKDGLWPVQRDSVNELAPLLHSAYYAEVGTGKTAMSTVHAVYQQLTGMCAAHVIAVPPILVSAWVRFLKRCGLSALAYRGTPKQRKALRLVERDQAGKAQPAHQFTVMSLQIFKQDYERITEEFKDFTMGLIVDEATSIKNVGSANHKHVRDFCTGRPLVLLTGTPLATPEDAYAYIKLLAPEVYRNKRVFDSIHVAERDFFQNVTKWGNLEILQKNMKLNAVRLLKKEVLPDLPDPIYQPIHYPLDEKHYALYKQLAEEQIIELESGGKIDATTVNKLYSCMQQVILNWGYFSECPDNVAAGYDLMDEVLAEIGAGQDGGRKLIVFINYQMTAGTLRERYGKLKIQVINGEVRSDVQRQAALETFMNDPQCGVIAIQPRSGAYGVDGLQHVSSDVLFLECPTSPIEFEQAVGRVYRTGQKNPPLIRIAVAENTIQGKLHRLLLNKDELTTFIQGGWRSLREALYGG